MTKCINSCKIYGSKKAVEDFNKKLISKQLFDDLETPEKLKEVFDLIITIAKENFVDSVINHIYSEYKDEIVYNYYSELSIPEFWLLVSLHFELNIEYAFANKEEGYAGLFIFSGGEVISETYTEDVNDRQYKNIVDAFSFEEELNPKQQIISFEKLKEMKKNNN